MTHPNTGTTETFKRSAQSSIPEYVFVYNHKGDHVEVKFENVTIKAPDGTVLIKDMNFTLKDGERAGLTGPNGGGKSTIFRHMGELTDGGTGRIHITLPEGKRMFNVSQEMRKTPTTLPGMLSYPNDPSNYTHDEYEASLNDAGLPQLKAHLPWNAAKPDVLFHMFKVALHNELGKNALNISPQSAEKMSAALIKGLDKKIDVPDTISDYFTPEYEAELREKIIAHTQEIFRALAPMPIISNSIFKKFVSALESEKKPDGMTEAEHHASILDKVYDENEVLLDEKIKNVLFPGFIGRKIAATVLKNGFNNMQNWLFMGHKMPLSGGQAEQLGFARLYLQVDEVGLFLLDEVSSALKEEKANELYNRLFEKANGVTAIGIIHQNGLLQHFTHHLELDENRHVSLIKLEGNTGAPAPQDPEI